MSDPVKRAVLDQLLEEAGAVMGSHPTGVDNVMARLALERIRSICLALPEAHEVEAWGEPTFRVRNKLFAMYANAGNHHGDGRHSVWIKSTPINQDLLLHSDAERFFKPPYVGPSGWIGVYLDKRPDWKAIAEIIRDGYVLTAPRKLLGHMKS